MRRVGARAGRRQEGYLPAGRARATPRAREAAKDHGPLQPKWCSMRAVRTRIALRSRASSSTTSAAWVRASFSTVASRTNWALEIPMRLQACPSRCQVSVSNRPVVWCIGTDAHVRAVRVVHGVGREPISHPASGSDIGSRLGSNSASAREALEQQSKVAVDAGDLLCEVCNRLAQLDHFVAGVGAAECSREHDTHEVALVYALALRFGGKIAGHVGCQSVRSSDHFHCRPNVAPPRFARTRLSKRVTPWTTGGSAVGLTDTLSCAIRLRSFAQVRLTGWRSVECQGRRRGGREDRITIPHHSGNRHWRWRSTRKGVDRALTTSIRCIRLLLDGRPSRNASQGGRRGKGGRRPRREDDRG